MKNPIRDFKYLRFGKIHGKISEQAKFLASRKYFNHVIPLVSGYVRKVLQKDVGRLIMNYINNIRNFATIFKMTRDFRFQQDFKEVVRDFKGVAEPLLPCSEG